MFLRLPLDVFASSRLALASLLILAGTASAAVDPGEILLSEMNCVACHSASPEIKARLAARQSPRLGTDGVRISPQHLRAFLENPAAAKPGTLMPDSLHGLDAAKKSEVAEALTHYLVSLQKPDTARQAGASSAAIAAGKTLYHTVGCVQCHAPSELPASAANNANAKTELEQLQHTSVPLGPLAAKYTVNELAAFLKDPLKARPSGRMPSLKLNDTEARAISMYLVRDQMPAGAAVNLGGLEYEYYEENLPELPEFDRLKPKTTGTIEKFKIKVAERKNNFAIRFRGTLSAPKDGEYKFWTRSDDGSRLSIDGQKIVENGGIHPAQDRDGKVKLSAGEHAIEVVYFDGGGQTEFDVSWQVPGGKRSGIPPEALSHAGQPMAPLGSGTFVVDAAKAAQGANHYISMQCASCHGDLPATASIDALTPAGKPLAQLRARQPTGCLATKPSANVPQFEITDRQRVVLLATLQNQALLAEPLEPNDRIKRTMTTLNCYACHQRDRRGGAEGLHRDYFASVGEVDLGDEGRIPPHLNNVGAKLQSDWIKQVLVEGAAVRPYMATRMPQFGEANAGQLPALFEKADASAEAQPPPDVWAQGMAGDANKFGRKLLGTTGMSCIACHNLGGNQSLGVPALDLGTVGPRLKWDWFRRYLLDPQELRPGTRMPSFWPAGISVNKEILAGDTEKQILSIWAYLARKNFTDLPPGLVRGKQEIIAQNEAVIYRNFIDGGGPRAIGVGYPEKANLAFDAEGMRLALIWQGSFIDAAKHRTGRGQGFEKPLGTNVVQGPAGPAFAILESDSAPWPTETGKVAGYQFHGYHLDAQRRPAFRYSFHDVQIEDYPIAIGADTDASFQRTITLRSDKAADRLYFRAAVAEKITEKDGAFLVGETLRLKFPGAKPLLRNSDGKTELLVPITFTGKEAKIVEEITW
ncbi:MAG: c-type cytochrome [Chthoniobacteraceae bacterium]